MELCASYAPACKVGDVIIPSGGVRMEGTSDCFLPKEFPAVPDYTVFHHMEQAARQSG